MRPLFGSPDTPVSNDAIGRLSKLWFSVCSSLVIHVDPVHLFLSLSSETEFCRKPPPIALSAVACININLL